MLPFLRDQNAGNSPAQKPAATNGRTADDGSERPQQQEEYITVATRKKQVRKSTIVLAVLFFIGLLCLWFMIKKSTPQTASATSDNTEETKIETAIARFTGVKSEMFSRMDEIVNRFYEFSNVPQVHVNELAKNPFELEMFLANLKAKADAEAETLDTDADTMWQQQIRQRAKAMQLSSVIQSEHGTCCVINDEILREGDPIGGFKVRQIGDGFVKLNCEDIEIVLKLSE
jgi:preprotein translocase subunit SecG